MSKYHWRYANAASTKVSGMVCTACRTRITEGDFRYRETDEAYLPQHRKCSQQDPKWARLDAEEKEYQEHEVARRAAFDEFVKKWGVPDDLIDECEG